MGELFNVVSRGEGLKVWFGASSWPRDDAIEAAGEIRRRVIQKVNGRRLLGGAREDRKPAGRTRGAGEISGSLTDEPTTGRDAHAEASAAIGAKHRDSDLKRVDVHGRDRGGDKSGA